MRPFCKTKTIKQRKWYFSFDWFSLLGKRFPNINNLFLLIINFQRLFIFLVPLALSFLLQVVKQTQKPKFQGERFFNNQEVFSFSASRQMFSFICNTFYCIILCLHSPARSAAYGTIWNIMCTLSIHWYVIFYWSSELRCPIWLNKIMFLLVLYFIVAIFYFKIWLVSKWGFCHFNNLHKGQGF